MDLPVVSVCMITYNHENYIAEAIASILNQEVNFEVELIIADDCSTDRTGDVVTGFISSHPKGYWIKYTRHEENKGMMKNFIWSLNQCKGGFIALCEGDDYWIDSNKLKIQTSLLQENLNFSLCFHDANFLNENGQVRRFSDKYVNLRAKNIFGMNDLMKFQWFIPTASILFRKVIIPDWFAKVSAGDFSLQLFLAEKGDFYYIDKVMSIYRIHSGGQSNFLRRYDLRMIDTKLWFFNLKKINRLRVFRWFFSNCWRNFFKK